MALDCAYQNAWSLLLPAAVTAFSNFAVRSPLQSSGFFKRGESSSRVTAATCSLIVCLYALLQGEMEGVSSYFGYVLADTVSSLLFGPVLRAEILVHHAITGALPIACCFYLVGGCQDGATRAPLAFAPSIAPMARMLLLMELSNPFLHAAWVTQKEESMAPYQWLVLPWAVPGVLGTFLYFRVAEGWRCLQYAVGHASVLLHWHTPVCSALAVLFALQVWWFYLLGATVAKAVLQTSRATHKEASLKE